MAGIARRQFLIAAGGPPAAPFSPQLAHRAIE